MNAVEKKLSFNINPEKIKKVVSLSSSFAGTQEQTLKDLFKDILIEIPQGQKTKIAVISVSNSKDLLKIVTPLEESINLDEDILMRVDASKLKGIVNNFNEIINVEYTDKYIKFKSENSSIKIHKTPANMLKEQFEIIEMNDTSDKIATINANVFLDLINQVSLIPLSEQKTGKPLGITFTEDKIKTASVQELGHYAAAGEINYPCNIEETLQIYIPPQIVPKLIQLLKALKEKPVDIYINKEKTKLQIKTKALSYTFFLSGDTLPEVHELIESIMSMGLKKVLVNKEQLTKATELINFVNGENTKVTAITEGNKMVLKSDTGEEVIKEIDAVSSEKAVMTASSTVILKSLKICSNAQKQENNIEIIFNEEHINYLMKYPEKDYPVVIFAGMGE